MSKKTNVVPKSEVHVSTHPSTFNKYLLISAVAIVSVITVSLVNTYLATDNLRGLIYSEIHVLLVAGVVCVALRK